MSAVDYYHPTVPAFSPMTSPSTVASDQLKCDFQNAVRRNLHSWTRWRIQLNDNLVDAVLKGNRMADVEPIGACLDRDSPQRGHPTNNPKTLLTYSAAANSSTPLPTDEFYKFGIPRARVDPSLPHQSQRQSVIETSVGPEVVRQARSSMTSLSAPDLVGERRRAVGHYPILPRTVTAKSFDRQQRDKPEELLSYYDDDDDDDDELVLDYFDFKDPLPATDKLLRRRQFHRSAATLPTVPSWSDDVASEAAPSRSNVSVSASTKKSIERRGQVAQSRSQQEQHQRRSVPSYVEPFSGRRHRMITARRDDVLYTTHDAWHIEEI